jgi:predicted ATP-binding protein involved in virulence
LERRPVVVKAFGKIGDHERVEWSRQINPDGKRTSNLKAKLALAHIKDIYARDNAGERLLCPALAYYGAGRAWLPSNERVPKDSKSNGPARRWGAFYDCFSERIRFGELQRWFLAETIERGNRAGKWRPGFETVRRAVLRCMPGAEDVWFSPDREQIVLSVNGNAQPFDNLSAGQRMMLALVADLAIKAVTQNAYLLPPGELGAEDDPLPRVLKETPGVVLIDELDVHLHPIWQRRVATDLKETFPSIQFICTSHSPQVVGAVKPEEVRVMDGNEVTTPKRTFGIDSDRVLDELMDGSSRNEATKRKLSELAAAFNEENFSKSEQLLNEVENPR